jgi:hypothetical protein
MKITKFLFYFLFFLTNTLSFGQEKTNSNIIKKDIETVKGKDIFDFPTNNVKSFMTEVAIKKQNKKNVVYYNGRFFSSDTLSKIKNINDYSFEIIKIPDSITKDIEAIIYLKKDNK